MSDLEVLSAFSLVSFDTADDGSQRIRVHRLVRELAREEWGRLSTERQHVALTGLLAGVEGYISSQLTSSRAFFYSPLLYDEDLIVSALRAAFEQQSALPLAFQIMGYSHSWTLGFSHRAESEIALNQLRLQGARAAADQPEVLKALRALMGLNGVAGDLNAVDRYRSEAIQVARALDDRNALIRLLSSQANQCFEHGEREQAYALYAEIREQLGVLNDAPSDAGVLASLGQLHMHLGHHDEAASLFQQVRAIEAEQGDRLSEALIVCNLGENEDARDQNALAHEYYEESRRLIADIGSVFGDAVMTHCLGELALKTGDIDGARSYLTRALHLFESIEHSVMTVHVRGNLVALEGEVARLSGEGEEARRFYQEALDLLGQEGEPNGCIKADRLAFVRARMALLQPAASAQAPAGEPPSKSVLAADLVVAVPVAVESVVAGATMPRVRRRGWPWRRR
jgi:tetratricopeptide (TPR) repeat protein